VWFWFNHGQAAPVDHEQRSASLDLSDLVQPVLFLAVLFLLLVGLVLDNTFGFGTVQGPRVYTYTNDWMLWCNCDKIGLPRQGSIECMANVVKQRMTSC
jgi:hypothetical protein